MGLLCFVGLSLAVDSPKVRLGIRIAEVSLTRIDERTVELAKERYRGRADKVKPVNGRSIASLRTTPCEQIEHWQC